MWQWSLIPIAYLIGSLSSAILVCRLAGLPDPRTEGSKNPGATNVLRIGGKGPALLTLLGDMLKGLLPVVVARWLGGTDAVIAACGLAAWLGHLYPLYFGFKGGKGVATGLGVMLGFSWAVGLAGLFTWLAVAFATRYSSLSALTAAVLVPFYVWFFTGSVALVVAVCAISLILILRHSGNIQRLRRGEESKIRL